jgi:predicted transcriptional regulator
MPADLPYSIRIPKDLKRALEQEARREDRTVAWLIVNVMRQWLSWKKEQK